MKGAAVPGVCFRRFAARPAGRGAPRSAARSPNARKHAGPASVSTSCVSPSSKRTRRQRAQRCPGGQGASSTVPSYQRPSPNTWETRAPGGHPADAVAGPTTSDSAGSAAAVPRAFAPAEAAPAGCPEPEGHRVGPEFAS